MLYYDIEAIQSYAAGTLAELVKTVEGAKQIEQHGATAQLTDLMHSLNENIGKLLSCAALQPACFAC